MKVNKALLVIALLVSVHASAWHIPGFDCVRTVASYVTGKVFCWTHNSHPCNPTKPNRPRTGICIMPILPRPEICVKPRPTDIHGGRLTSADYDSYDQDHEELVKYDDGYDLQDSGGIEESDEFQL